MRAQHAEAVLAQGDRDEHGGTQHQASEDDEDGVHAVVEGDLDEEVGGAPQRREEPHEQPRAAGHDALSVVGAMRYITQLGLSA